MRAWTADVRRASGGNEVVTLPLLIGGPRHGHVMPIPDRCRSIRVPRAVEATLYPVELEVPEAPDHQVDQYVRQQLTADGGEVIVEAMVHDGLEGHAVTRSMWHAITDKLKASAWTTEPDAG